MEAAGIYEAAQQMNHQYPVMAIRGISDIVGLKRNKRWTEYACQTAAAFAYAFIMTAPLDPQVDEELLPSSTNRLRSGDEARNSHRDWGEAPDRSPFFGRTEELAMLEQWIVNEQCQLVAVIGMGGMGKTELSVKLGKGGIGKTDLSLELAQGIQDHFEYVIWRRLLSAPKLTDILLDLIKFLSDQQEVSLPSTVEGQISRLLFHLRQHRCLLILDNVEAILQGGKLAGQYREGYEGYGQLFRQVAEVPHQSCLLLTSREKPPEIARLEGKTRPVRSLELGGLNYLDSKKVFAEIGSFSGSDEDWRELNEFYNGNPLALELAARHIHDVFFGSITEFLKEGKQVFADLRDLLDWHFDRLSDEQKEIMNWLAISGEPMSLSELKEDILSPVAKEQVPSTLQQLQRKIPLEKSPSRFTLQPVLLEYATERLVEQVVKEIRTKKLELFNTFALLKALTKDYIRDSQSRLIVKPINDRLIAIWGSQVRFEAYLKQILSMLREEYPLKPGYAGGNVLNMLCQLKTDISNFDFSSLTVWQAYLQGIDLHDVNFAHADLEKSVFTDTFGSILSVAFSPRSGLLAAGIATGEIRIWQTSGTPYLTWQAHWNWVRSVAFSPDEKILASGSDDQTVCLWEINTGTLLRTLEGHTSRVRSVAFSHDGQVLVTGSDDQTVRVWEVNTGACLRVLEGHTSRVRSVAFSPDGTILASGSLDQTVRVWEVNTGACLRVLEGHTSRVRSVAFSPDGKILISGGEDQTIRVWEVDTGTCLRILEGHTSRIRSVAFSPDGEFLASCGEDQIVRLWEFSSERYFTLPGHTSTVRSVAFSPDGKILASGGDDRALRLWEVSAKTCIRTLQGHGNVVRSVAFDPNRKILISAGEDRAVHLWKAENWQYLGALKEHTHRIMGVAFDPTGKVFASGSEDRTVRLWETDTRKCLHILEQHSRVRSVAFSPDGEILISGNEDRTVRLWRVSTGECLKILQGHADSLRSVAFSPRGNIVASSSDDRTVRLWEVDTGECLHVLQGLTKSKWILSVAFSPDGSILATGSEDVRLWQVKTGECLHILQGHTEQVYAVAISPDGKLLSSGGDDRKVRLWEIETETCLHNFEGHTRGIRSIAFSADGTIFASGSHDGTIRLWNVQTKTPLKTLISYRPYEKMNITDVHGLTNAQKATLRALGAYEEPILA